MRPLSFQSYLTLCRDRLADPLPKTIVLGNSAADLDSMASSLAYAYLLSTRKDPRLAHIIPVMPIPRADCKLRPEAVYVFRKAGINPQEIIFFDEIDLSAIMAAKGNLVLVDHNKLAANLNFDAKVIALVDHHADEGFYQNASPRIIKTVGSTASLVTLEILKENPALLDKKVATLLLGTILLDTINLDPKAERVSALDQEAVHHLLPIFNANQDHFFARIQEEKFTLTALSSADLLRKDYKQWQLETTSYGISTVLTPLTEWLRRDPLLPQALVNFSTAQGITILLVMIGYTTPEFKRDLLIYTTNQEIHVKLLQKLEKHDLQLTAISPPNLAIPTQGVISFYNQANLTISRKTLQPILQKSLEKYL